MCFISEIMVQINLKSGSGVESWLATSLLAGVLAAPLQWLLPWVLRAVSQLAVGTWHLSAALLAPVSHLPCLLLSPTCLASSSCLAPVTHVSETKGVLCGSRVLSLLLGAPTCLSY